MKVALVHDYFFQAGGAERVMEVLHEMYPDAPIYTTVLTRDTLWPRLRTADIRTSWLQSLLALGIPARALLPLYPTAIESLDLSGYDLVISNSSAFAKGAIVNDETCHVCYCHTPMRFAWSEEAYSQRERFSLMTRAVLRPILAYMRHWDRRTRHRPSAYLGNSTSIVQRIWSTYGIEAERMFPPVDVSRCHAAPVREDYYLVVSRLSPYKRIDLAVEAFNILGKRLVIIGDGPDRTSLEAMAGPTVQLLGRLPDAEVAQYYAAARGFILPGEEDFGITPLEANASGCPVIACGAGGALDTVIDGRTGVHFAAGDVRSLAAAVQRSESIAWDPALLRAHAEAFGEGPFARRMYDAIDRAYAQFHARRSSHPRVAVAPRARSGRESAPQPTGV